MLFRFPNGLCHPPIHTYSPSHTYINIDVPQMQVMAAATNQEQPSEPAPDLKDVFKELYITADKWENTGVLLGIQPGQLNAIKTAENLPQNCLREMLKIWLKIISPPPTWLAIAEAVEFLGDQELATRLRRKYIVLSQP